MTAALPPAERRAGLAGTVLAHAGLLVALLLTAHRARPTQGMVYEVNLVAAPLPTAVRNAPSEATPAAPEEVVPQKVVPTKSTPRPKPAPVAKRDDKTPATRPTAAPAPNETPSTGNDVVTLRQSGISFPYPEYLRNIENQIFQHWIHNMFRPGLDAKVAFIIEKDGSVNPASIEIFHSSNNSQFDLNARGAVESAANARAFGPLPSGFDRPSLPIIFDFAQVAGGHP